MTTDLVTVSPETEVMRAVYLLVEHDISGMPVIDESGRLVGMLTERDCIATAINASYFDEAGGSVQNFMSSPVETAQAGDSLMDIAERLGKSSYRRFPVIEDGRVVGLISRRDVLKALKRGTWFKP
jgi:CBS domain-containing protein